MTGSPTWDVLVLLAAAVTGLSLLQVVHLAIVLAWGEARTKGTRYFGRPASQRRRLKRLMSWNAFLLTPSLMVLARLSPKRLSQVTLRFKGYPFPKGTCTRETVQRAVDYRPRGNDVFVVTQMKCGTTWMQHLVYQVLTRGAGDLAAEDRTLYSFSPWLEATKSVAVDDAGVVGAERPSRVIKTHLPADLCPNRPDARYLYVTRHPVSCFASCVDFVRTNMGGFAPDIREFERWFTDDEAMWWGTWPAHVSGWWKRSRQDSNVLFVRFEDMKADLADVVRQVGDFLQMEPLSEQELANVLHKCSFEYMQGHSDLFEMTPPHILQDGTGLFVSGKEHRYRDVPHATRTRISQWCRVALEGQPRPLIELYPDLATDQHRNTTSDPRPSASGRATSGTSAIAPVE